MTNNQHCILWADDEIDLLKPHLLFLQSKGYNVVTAISGRDAIDTVADNRDIDLVFLDENMPGLTGLETLAQIKQLRPELPVAMITKSEEEHIMDQAIGSKIADYLIKPVNPSQILLAIKKILHSDELVSQQASTDYRHQFAELSDAINSASTFGDWCQLYSRLVYWELELTKTDTNMDDMLQIQRDEANKEFSKFVKANYDSWVAPTGVREGAPLMSPQLMPHSIFPLLDRGQKIFLIVIDNFRLDQWRAILPMMSDNFVIDERLYMAMLPTATQYARNAIFSGLMPTQIESLFPDLWVEEDSPEGKNLNESPLIATLLDRYRKHWRYSYHKINDSSTIDGLLRNFSALEDNDLNVIVVNFIDMLSHARTESKMIRELAPSNAAYRSLTESWFRHSAISDLMSKIAERGYKAVITTDHGSIRVNNPVKIIGDKNTNANLRYKVGKNLNCTDKHIYALRHPADCGLPEPNLTSSYMFACGSDFFAYPNNYNHYVQYYSGTFQHGGISMEEMLVPIIFLAPKR